MEELTVRVKSGGSKSWWLNDVKLSEEDFNKKLNSCEVKMVEIDGRKYKLTEI